MNKERISHFNLESTKWLWTNSKLQMPLMRLKFSMEITKFTLLPLSQVWTASSIYWNISC